MTNQTIITKSGTILKSKTIDGKPCIDRMMTDRRSLDLIIEYSTNLQRDEMMQAYSAMKAPHINL